jgi:LysM repeat protein
MFYVGGRRGGEEDKPVDVVVDVEEKAETAVQQVVEDKPLEDLIETAPEDVSETDPKVTELINEAMACLGAESPKIIEARDRLNELLPMAMSAEQRSFVKGKLSDLADKWLFSRTVFPEDGLCGNYKVNTGDLLSTIGKQFGVPYEILMEINGLSRPESLKAGEMIKVINGPFHARVYRSTFTMDLYLQNTFVRSFPVGLGAPGRETPLGLWEVKKGGKLVRPTWTDPDTGKTYEAEDPDYPLGSRWIALEGLKGEALGRSGIAFHGTNDANLIGTAGSRGCIRLHNGDAILVYNLVMPSSSQVEIVD